MARVVRNHRQGAPDVLQIEDEQIGEPGPGELRLRVEAVGLNRSEAMYRAGRYPVPCELPSRMGYEGVGTIEALGAGYIGDLTGGVFGSNYQDVFAFIVLICVLLFRPSGIMGERVADRA